MSDFGPYPALPDDPDRLSTGDTADDDPMVLDALVQQEAEPPEPDEQPIEQTQPQAKPRPVTRLLTQTVDIQPGWNPVLLLPADPDRMELLIRAEGEDGAYVLLSDDAGKVQMGAAAFRLDAGRSWGIGATHTGPVWASCGIAGDKAVNVSVVAVTK